MHLKLEIRTTCSLYSVRKIADTFVAALDSLVSSDTVAEMQIALSEACTNVVKHGNQSAEEMPFEAALELDSEQVRITLKDHGAPFDPRNFTRPQFDVNRLESLPTNGMGLALINDLVDSIEYKRSENVNILVLTKRIQQTPLAQLYTLPVLTKYE